MKLYGSWSWVQRYCYSPVWFGCVWLDWLCAEVAWRISPRLLVAIHLYLDNWWVGCDYDAEMGDLCIAVGPLWLYVDYKPLASNGEGGKGA